MRICSNKPNRQDVYDPAPVSNVSVQTLEETPDSWVNALVTIRLPWDIPIDASYEEKLQAARDAIPPELLEKRNDPDYCVVLEPEDVVDGEPIG